MMKVAYLAVNRPPPDHSASKRFTQTLVSKADAENWDSPADESREIDANACLTRSTWPGGEDYVAGLERYNRLEVDRIVARHDRLLAQLLQVA